MTTALSGSIAAHLDRSTKQSQVFIAELSELRALLTASKDTLYQKFRELKHQMETDLKHHMAVAQQNHAELDLKVNSSLARLVHDMENQEKLVHALHVKLQDKFTTDLHAARNGLEIEIADAKQECMDVSEALRHTTENKFAVLRTTMAAREANVDAFVATLRHDLVEQSNRVTLFKCFKSRISKE